MTRLTDADALYMGLVKMKDFGELTAKKAIRVVKNAPTIEAEPVRHGKFIGTEYDGYADGNPVYYEWKCSECGCVFEEDEPTYRYCPNCGARMDAE